MKNVQAALVAIMVPLVASQMMGCAAGPSRTNAFETLTATSDYSRKWTSAEAKDGISGHTFLSNYPGKRNEVTFFHPNGIAYQWMSGRPVLANGSWMVDMRSPRSSESARVFICTTYNNRNRVSGEIIPDSITNRCVDPSLYFIPAAERTKGDTFQLAGREIAPGKLTIERTRIEDIKAKLRSTPPG